MVSGAVRMIMLVIVRVRVVVVRVVLGLLAVVRQHADGAENPRAEEQPEAELTVHPKQINRRGNACNG